MTKPSLHELISKEIYEYIYYSNNGYLNKLESDELAEKIIKIIRDYHLTE